MGRTLHLRLTDDEHAILKALAFQQGKSMQVVALDILRPGLEEQGKGVRPMLRAMSAAMSAARKAGRDG